MVSEGPGWKGMVYGDKEKPAGWFEVRASPILHALTFAGWYYLWGTLSLLEPEKKGPGPAWHSGSRETSISAPCNNTVRSLTQALGNRP